MRYSTAKKLFLLCIVSGLILGFSPMIYGIIIYDEPMFNLLTYIGFGLVMFSYVFDRMLSRCPMCKKPIGTPFGGIAYVFMRAKTKRCPHCLV